MDDVLKDKRFKHIARDPRFRRMKRKDRKVKIDKRFQGMFKDNQFKLKYTVDKRGRPIHSSTNENLQKYYEMDSSDEEDEEDSNDQEKTPVKEGIKKKEEEITSAKKTTKSEVPDSNESGEEEDTEAEKMALKFDQTAKDKRDVENSEADTSEEDSDDEEDLARGQGNVETSSSEDEDDTEEQEELDHKWGELAKDAELVSDATCRMALCNMDWDRIKASDIFVLMNSFKPPHGTINSVTIYPSEYGQQRLKEEETKGPIELVESQGDKANEDDPQHRERLRQYQLNRLRYYYAVITCDSVQTANHIYEECDGMEYESSANKIDLRFIPEDMTFDQEPKCHASHMPDATTYKPTLFSNSALNQSKVDLTWDETDKDRIAMTMRKFKQDELEEMDVKDYLASSSGSDGEGDDPYAGFEDPDFGSPETAAEPAVNKLKELVKGADAEKAKEKAAGGELEITWEAGLNSGTTQNKKKKDGDLTQWELYLEKKKEKKKQRREEKSKSKSAAKSGDGSDVEDGDAFSDDDLPSGVDLQDSYFQEELSQSQSAGTEGKSSKKKNKKKAKGVKEPGDVDEEAQLQMLMMDEEDGRQHFSLAAIQQKEQGGKKKKRKAKRKQDNMSTETQDTFQLNVGDDRFRDIYNNPLYNIDPSAPEYKKTQAMDALVEEKFKRRKKGSKEDKSKLKDSENPSKKPKLESGTLQDASLASLVKSVKAKTKTLQDKKKKKMK